MTAGPVEDSSYDLIFFTIAMQHICVYEIRLQILQSMFKALKNTGRISIQMGFGRTPEKRCSDYYANNYYALKTNSWCDTRVDDPEQIKNDL